ncbi:MAG: hypothetical protein UT30_C0047G0004 [Candidatus Uhrbacteria bacterium GW2011_GWF2_39_13]|uniref:Uncharacterized protein n=1 Tax=Candidatus Uhrbacteria bacterium GW2011_GWF2_39_13 TaxID=1618995 RepID=A0A0G0MFJ6_9BACT|nr:MAG: hypothetical protein UT30_C0047G0004 [Candidatus Uhrbacteria bacterium GW2011_GWF2_39_13]
MVNIRLQQEEACQRVRNRIKSLRPEELIIAASLKLREIEKDIALWSKWNPYSLLLVIRWAFEYGAQNSNVIPLTQNQFIKLISDCNEICGNPYFLSGASANVNKFLRTMSFQQFWFQGNIFKGLFGRLFLLFCNSKDEIHENFLFRVGISMQEYLELSFAVWGWTPKQSNEVLVPLQFFENSTYEITAITKYFDFTSKTILQMTDYLQTPRKKGIRNFYLQPCEKSPLTKYPLLRLPGGIFKYSQRVFESHIRMIFYELMKSTGDSPLAEKFSKRFENYNDKLLAYSCLPYLKETELKKIAGKGKVVDFAIPYADTTILIETKSVEMNPLAQVNPENKIMEKELKSSVIKAVIQAYEFIYNLKQVDTTEIECKKHFSLLIVTYDNLWLGPPLHLWKEFLENSVRNRIKPELLDEAALSPERIFVISIDEMEVIIERIKLQVVSLPDFIERAVADNRTEKVKHQLNMHFTERECEETKGIPFLIEPFEIFCKSLRSKFVK